MASLSATAFSGDSVMAAQMRSHDWRQCPLGAPDTWPPSLRTAVDMLLHSAFPMFVAWGPQHIVLYNDAYIPAVSKTKCNTPSCRVLRCQEFIPI